jgi:Ca2+-binding RTX toxin-like protein
MATPSGAQGTFSVDGGVFRVPDQPPPPTVALSSPSFSSDPQIAGAGAWWTVMVGGLPTTVLGGAAPAQIIGGSGADSLVGGTAATTITGGSGPATIIGGSGVDSLVGGSGKNLIFGGTGPETIVGGAGANVIYGGGIHNAILGGSADDRIATADTIFGGSGPTTIIGGTGPSTIIGGSGPTTIVAHYLFTDPGPDLIADQGTVIHDTVFGFSQALGDAISFAGENAQTIAAVVGSAQVSNGNTTITLPDSSTITLVGITHIDGSFFH